MYTVYPTQIIGVIVLGHYRDLFMVIICPISVIVEQDQICICEQNKNCFSSVNMHFFEFSHYMVPGINICYVNGPLLRNLKLFKLLIELRHQPSVIPYDVYTLFDDCLKHTNIQDKGISIVDNGCI